MLPLPLTLLLPLNIALILPLKFNIIIVTIAITFIAFIRFTGVPTPPFV